MRDDEDYCNGCEAVTRWDGETCTGCGWLWGAGPVGSPEYEAEKAALAARGSG